MFSKLLPHPCGPLLVFVRRVGQARQSLSDGCSLGLRSHHGRKRFFCFRSTQYGKSKYFLVEHARLRRAKKAEADDTQSRANVSSQGRFCTSRVWDLQDNLYLGFRFVDCSIMAFQGGFCIQRGMPACLLMQRGSCYRWRFYDKRCWVTLAHNSLHSILRSWTIIAQRGAFPTGGFYVQIEGQFCGFFYVGDALDRSEF